jgi:hypothetical protein
VLLCVVVVWCCGGVTFFILISVVLPLFLSSFFHFIFVFLRPASFFLVRGGMRGEHGKTEEEGMNN